MGASDANHLSPENSFLYHEPTLETHWPRNYKFYQTKFKPSFVVRTRNALGEIEQSQGISNTYFQCLYVCYLNCDCIFLYDICSYAAAY